MLKRMLAGLVNFHRVEQSRIGQILLNLIENIDADILARAGK